jgi:glyoxylase-like metal-dependent hydrolase (beta-lactamase superfamily II)
LKNVKRERIIWEEITGEPFIYRIYAAGSERNTYLFLDGKEALVIDPRSPGILRSVCRLAKGHGVESEGIQVFLTDAFGEEMCEMIRSVPGEMTLYSAAWPDCPPDVETDGSSSREVKPDTGEYLSGGTDTGRHSPEEMESSEGIPIRPWKKIRDGDTIRIGDRILCVLNLEGCRKGLTGLWFAETGILFTGESVGSGYLPVVQDWDLKMDTLGLQIEVLRRMINLTPQCILPGCGMLVGIDNLPEPEGNIAGEEIEKTGSDYRNAFLSASESVFGKEKEKRRISPECEDVLNVMLTNYCLRILEVYQKIPVQGTIREEELIQPEHAGERASTMSCLKYLLYRKYVRRHETQDGYLYERGSLRLTDWLAASLTTP